MSVSAKLPNVYKKKYFEERKTSVFAHLIAEPKVTHAKCENFTSQLHKLREKNFPRGTIKKVIKEKNFQKSSWTYLWLISPNQNVVMIFLATFKI